MYDSNIPRYALLVICAVSLRDKQCVATCKDTPVDGDAQIRANTITLDMHF